MILSVISSKAQFAFLKNTRVFGVSVEEKRRKDQWRSIWEIYELISLFNTTFKTFISLHQFFQCFIDFLFTFPHVLTFERIKAIGIFMSSSQLIFPQQINRLLFIDHVKTFICLCLNYPCFSHKFDLTTRQDSSGGYYSTRTLRSFLHHRRLIFNSWMTPVFEQTLWSFLSRKVSTKLIN